MRICGKSILGQGTACAKDLRWTPVNGRKAVWEGVREACRGKSLGGQSFCIILQLWRPDRM